MNSDLTNIMVTIRCTAYNHESYIRQCLDGFIMQKTNFCFEAIIHDDASTDRTAVIIKEYADKYPNIIKPIFQKENQYSKHDGSITRIMNEHTHGKYIAICEGDDYWTDPYKLQKQVDFLETHPEYGLCHTAFKDTLSNKIQSNTIFNKNDSYLYHILTGEYNIGTQTTLFRKDIYFKLPRHDKTQNFKMGDYPLWIEFAYCSKIKYLDDCTAVYRVLSESASHSKDINKEIAFHQSCVNCRIYYSKLYEISIPLKYQRSYLVFMKTAFMHKNKSLAKEIISNAISEKLLSLKIVIFFFGIIFEPLGKLIEKTYYTNK